MFELECEDVAMMNINHINVKLELSQKSTLGSKTLKFNSLRNSMTLTYKYIGTKFDTSYKPSVSVKKLSSIYYFTMTSYKGSFKNSNKTYSVIAKVKFMLVLVLQMEKNFTVDFNL